MARDETDREDLLREATALTQRIELSSTGPASATGKPAGENIVVGFRLGGAISIFFGGDPVYQFNAAGELRRAYYDGLIYKAWNGRLVSLERHRTPHEVQLIRRDLTDDVQNAFLTRMCDRLRKFADELNSGRLQIVGQVPPDADILDRVRTWFAEHDSLPIAQSPGVASK